MRPKRLHYAALDHICQFHIYYNIYTKIKPLCKHLMLFFTNGPQTGPQKMELFFLIKSFDTHFLNIKNYITCNFNQAILHKITQ
jgi:hypothetical protein